jgi:hypothetical protein
MPRCPRITRTTQTAGNPREDAPAAPSSLRPDPESYATMHAKHEASPYPKTTESTTFPDTTRLHVGNRPPNPWNPCNPWFSKAWTSASPRIARIGVGPVPGGTAIRSFRHLAAKVGCFVFLSFVVCFEVPLAGLAAETEQNGFWSERQTPDVPFARDVTFPRRPGGFLRLRRICERCAPGAAINPTEPPRRTQR